MTDDDLLLAVHAGDDELPFVEDLSPCTFGDVFGLLHDCMGFMPATMCAAVQGKPVRMELLGLTLHGDDLCVLMPEGHPESATIGDYIRLQDFPPGQRREDQPGLMMFKDALLRIAMREMDFIVRLTDADRLYEPIALDKINIMGNAEVHCIGMFERDLGDGQVELVLLTGIMITRALIEGHSQLTYKATHQPVVAVRIDELTHDATSATSVNKLMGYLVHEDIIDPGAWWLGLGSFSDEGH